MAGYIEIHPIIVFWHRYFRMDRNRKVGAKVKYPVEFRYINIVIVCKLDIRSELSHLLYGLREGNLMNERMEIGEHYEAALLR